MLANSAWAYDVNTGDGENVLAVTHVVNVTGRISDLRDMGHAVECFKVKGVNRYRLMGGVEPLGVKPNVEARFAATHAAPPTFVK